MTGRQTRRWGTLAVAGVFPLALALLATGAAPAGDGRLVPPSGDDAVRAGRRLYEMHCLNCHGDQGRGDGPTGGVLTVPPADLTRIAERHAGVFPREEIHRVIDGRAQRSGHGAQSMPIWGLSFQDPSSDANQEAEVRARIARLLDYLQSIQRP